MRAVCLNLLIFLSGSVLLAASPQDLVRQSVANYLRDYREGTIRYTFMQHDIEGDAKVLLVKDHPLREQIVFYNFKPVEAKLAQK